MKKLLSILLAVMMIMALAVPAFAQTIEGTSEDGASITISNAAYGVKYEVYKVFDASVTGAEGGSIAYTLMTGKTEAPAGFEVDAAGNVSAVADDADIDFAALLDYGVQVAEGTAAGDGITFTGLPYGYYVVKTNQGEGKVTVTSTNPTATIIDKNTTTPIGGASKSVDDTDVFVGETVTYTVSFTTASYNGENQIKSYTIIDTLPEFLSDVNVTGITVGGTAIDVQQFDETGKIVIPWVDENNVSLYPNGAMLTITYTAVVNDNVTISGEGNTNTVSIDFDDGTNVPHGGPIEKSEKLYTYAIAIQKVDENGAALAGATFSLDGYNVAGAAGVYFVTGETAEGGKSITMDCDAAGLLIIKGVPTGDYTLNEEAAPAGYNKLTTKVPVTASKTGETTITKYFDADGKQVAEAVEGGTSTAVAVQSVEVENLKGAVLPSTGGIGTTIFTVVGIVLMAGAAVLFITKKRVDSKEG